MSTSILRFLNKTCGLALVCAASQSASAFSVFGPAETWQVPTLDYVTRYYYPYPGGNSAELGGPKNFGEGSRINTPILTYGYDITFLAYFGAKGVAAVDSAMAVLNALPASSAANLSSFLMQGNQQINYTAQALDLTDLKSMVLSIMLEHMGINGETHVWDLHTRNGLTGPPPCLFEYLVINRNFDPATYLPSSYVNGINYTYQIWDGCSNTISVADAIEFPADGASAAELTYSAVATLYGLQPGGYYLGLTYDDMGGLKYLYSKNNLAWEALDPTAVATTLGAGGSSWEGVTDTNATGGAGGPTVGTNFSAGYLGGVEKITYVKLPSDSILGGGFTPRTFTYSIPWLTNGGVQNLHVTRTVTQPDIIFSAADLVGNTLGGAPFMYSAYSRGFNFIASGAAVVANGVVPEVISPQETITFNDITPFWVNESPSFLDQQSVLEYPGLYWGSFDGSTNAPVLYPSSSSVSALMAELFSGSSTGSQSSTWLGLTLSTNASASGSGGASP
ncbi:MAG TPA: hypothetical protein VMR33_03170 [Candidatus Baltobacteraceae bacterium]|nr:hypothetical protein [Candidatus Baltobacteraceae bacterium]